MPREVRGRGRAERPKAPKESRRRRESEEKAEPPSSLPTSQGQEGQGRGRSRGRAGGLSEESGWPKLEERGAGVWGGHGTKRSGTGQSGQPGKEQGVQSSGEGSDVKETSGGGYTAFSGGDTPSTSQAAGGDTPSTSQAAGRDTPSTSQAAGRDTPSTSQAAGRDTPSTSQEVADVASSSQGAGTYTIYTSTAGEGRKKRVIELITTRPQNCASKKGKTGREITLVTNYFDIQSMPNWILYQYQVTFDVEVASEYVKKGWLYAHKGTAIKSAFIFDGGHLYTSERLTDKRPDILKVVTRSKDNVDVHIEIKFLQKLRRGHGAYLQVFNVLLRRCLASLHLSLVQRSYFDPKASVLLPNHHLEVWPGYATHIREHDGGIMMCAKVSHKVMRTDTAYDVLLKCINSKDYKRSYVQAIVGAVVLTDYTNKTYQIADVDYDRNPLSTFKYQSNDITLADYYKMRYNITIQDLNQPLLATRKVNKNKSESEKGVGEILLIPELCRMTGLNARMVNNKHLMKDMSAITRVSPSDRMKRLEAFNERLHSSPEVLKEFKEWGLDISRRLKNIKGRVLPTETILVGQNKTFSAGREYDWTVPLRSSPMFFNPKWGTMVLITAEKIKDAVENFLPILKKAAEGMHIKLPTPIIRLTESESSSEMVNMIEKSFSMDNPDRYSAIKRKCCVDRGVASQVVLLKSMNSKGVLSIATKIAIQIHAKMGGVPWNVSIPTEKCMVVGFDVCHDTFTKSVGAMVASTSPNMTTWYSSVNQHSSREEISFYLANDIVKAIKKFSDRCKSLPTRLVVYRDGVGEGQIGHVMEHEVNALKERLNELYDGPNWKLAYIIVTKRINTRLFLPNANPPPGTIVDDYITQPERYDFYLVSQSVRQGTVTPTLYSIISDNIAWSPDVLQRFTYKLTHMYYNSSAPVQVPAPCQYAHKLAFLANQALHCPHHPNLNERLFFL